MPTLDYVLDCCCRDEGQRVCSLAHSGHIMAEWDEGEKLQVSPAAPLPRLRRAGKLHIAMADIVLTTLNAKYIHAAFGLRYLLANLGSLQGDACIVEFDINQRPVDIAEALLARNPKIIGLGIYIWNVAPATEVVATLKRVRPAVTARGRARACVPAQASEAPGTHARPESIVVESGPEPASLGPGPQAHGP